MTEVGKAGKTRGLRVHSVLILVLVLPHHPSLQWAIKPDLCPSVAGWLLEARLESELKEFLEIPIRSGVVLRSVVRATIVLRWNGVQQNKQTANTIKTMMVTFFLALSNALALLLSRMFLSL
ncbi:hypothetical protein EYF80_009715 [Liparis tanakae]|uniref:Uncharacterized protein n=1 Tax=Liparis tanakae TaxID=230148 RepID=A0A4Z2IS90_9TELE|nr:hypothetical protein EYF80_009715 [Liparis tanakae]